MKFFTTSMTVALLALAVGTQSADAKGKLPKTSSNPVEAYLKAHDTNKNGTIEPTEFATGSREEFKKWDKNNDGKLDKGELAAYLKKDKK